MGLAIRKSPAKGLVEQRHTWAFLLLTMGTACVGAGAAVSEQPLGCAFVPQTEPLFLVFLLEKREGREQKLTTFLIFLDLRISSQG